METSEKGQQVYLFGGKKLAKKKDTSFLKEYGNLEIG